MPRKKSKTTKVDVKKVKDRRLIDDYMVKPTPSGLPVVMTAIILIALIAAVAAVGYFYFYRAALENSDREAPPQLPDIQVQEPAAPVQAGTEEEEPEPAVEIQKIVISETPTGYLNVRSGPGTGFEQIARVSPGEQYELLQTDAAAGWYQIRLNDGSAGWITQTYARTASD